MTAVSCSEHGCSISNVCYLKNCFSCSNFSKDHRDKTEVPDPLVVEDLISDKLNDRRKLGRLIKVSLTVFGNRALTLAL